MLEQFQAVYPQGRLISELVTIYHGKFIVRTIIQMGGEILASGLAAGDTVEMAEDLARGRSLQNLGLSNIQNQHQVVNQVNQNNQVNHQSDLINSPVAVTPVSVSVGKNLAVKSESLNILDNGIVEQPVITPQTELIKPDLAIEEKAPDVDKSNILRQEELAQTVNIDSQDIPLISDIPATLPSMQANQDNHQFGEDAWLYTDYTKKSEESVKSSAVETIQPVINNDMPQVLAGQSHIEIPTDLSDVHVKLELFLDRLAWDKEREREFLQQTYQERSRDRLPDEKLVDFATYLEVLCQVVEELKRQGWKPSQERDYLEYNWQGRTREELTKSELEAMYLYLQVFEQTTLAIKRLGWTAEYGKKYLLDKYLQQGRARLTYEQLLDFQEYLATQ
ncbi:MAG: hypothetical protein ACRC2J_20530 [Microcoleaceae cyanobacterium]